MADFDLDTFVSAPTEEQLSKCRKEDLVLIAAHYKLAVSKQLRKLEIRSAVSQGLVELGVLKLSGEGISDSDGRPGEEERSETAEVVESEAKAVLPPSDPFSPGSDESEGGDARLKVRLARVQMEARERAESRRIEVDLKYRLEIRRLEIEAETQIKLRELELSAADRTPIPVTQPSQTADAGTAGTTFESSLYCDWPSATKKKAKKKIKKTGGGPAPPQYTPAEELALGLNENRTIVEGIPEGSSSSDPKPGTSSSNTFITGKR
ncbi:unnamed protein product [Leuciscus chuanchicus]